MPASSERPADRDALKGYALALLAAACWGTGGLTAKWLFTVPSAATEAWPVPPLGIAIDPTTLSGARALSSAVLLLGYLALRRPRELRIAPKDIPFLAVFGVFGMAAVHFTYFKTISLTNVATAILLEYLAPVFVLLVSVLFLKHKFTWSLPAGVALSVGGCALVVGAVGGEGLVVSPAGIAWGLSSAVFFATYSLLGAVGAKRFSPWTLLGYGLAFAAAFWLVALGPADVLGAFKEPALALAVLYVALFSTIIPFTAFLAALHHIAPTNATVTATLEPVLAAVGAYFLFGETLSVLQITGALMVIAAIAVVQMPSRGTPALGVELPPPV